MEATAPRDIEDLELKKDIGAPKQILNTYKALKFDV
jgi:hypothetical protein